MTRQAFGTSRRASRCSRAALVGTSLALAASIAACGSDNEKKSDTKTGATPTAATTSTQPTNSTEATTSTQSQTFDLSQFESQLAQQLSGSAAVAQAGGTTAHVTQVQCPDSTTASPGLGVTCDVSGDGGLTGNVTVTFKDDTGKAYAYKAKLQTGKAVQTVQGTVSGK